MTQQAEESTAQTEHRLRSQGWSAGDIACWRRSVSARGRQATTTTRSTPASTSLNERQASYVRTCERIGQDVSEAELEALGGDQRVAPISRDAHVIQRSQVEFGADHWRRVLGK